MQDFIPLKIDHIVTRSYLAYDGSYSGIPFLAIHTNEINKRNVKNIWVNPLNPDHLDNGNVVNQHLVRLGHIVYVNLCMYGCYDENGMCVRLTDLETEQND